MISRLFAGVYGQGSRTVSNRQTSFGTFGGGDANICMPCVNICGTSGGSTTASGSDCDGQKSVGVENQRPRSRL